MVDFTTRLRDITWRSPKGTLFTLKSAESGYEQAHIGTVKQNPKAKKSNTTKVVRDSNDTFTSLGVGGRNTSLDFFFIGSNHDLDAKAFTDALCERGKSHLQLAYDEEFTVNVIKFSLKNDLVKNINATIVSVEFHETSPSKYPTSSTSGKKAVKEQAAQTNEITAQNLADTAEEAATDTARAQTFTDSYSAMMNKVSNTLNTAGDINLNSIMTDVLGQDVMTNAFTMTSQLQIVMSKAALLARKARSFASDFELFSEFESITGFWRTLVSSLMSFAHSGGSSGPSRAQIDSLLINDTAATSALSALCENSVDANYTTREEAVETVTEIITLEEMWTDFIEEQIDAITELGDVIIRDTGITELVAAACGEILRQSWELRVEKTIILSQDKTIIELAYENYPAEFEADPDATVEYLISSNKFEGDEIFLLEKGREVKIYV